MIHDKLFSGEVKVVIIDSEGVVRTGDRVCVLNIGNLIRLILEEAQSIQKLSRCTMT